MPETLDFDNSYFIKRLRNEMIKKKITHQRLAEKTGITINRINQYLDEKKPTYPRIDTACALAKALGMSLDSLVGLEVSGTPQSLLENLAHLCNEGLFKLEVDLSGNVCLSVKNEAVIPFLIELKKHSDFDMTKFQEEADTQHLVEKYAQDLIFYRGHLRDKVKHLDMLKDLYIYGDTDKDRNFEAAYGDLETLQSLAVIRKEREETWIENIEKNDFTFLKKCSYIQVEDYAALL